MSTTSKKVVTILLGTCLLASVSFTSCNNDGEKKAPEKTDVPPMPTPTPPVTDSPKTNVAPAAPAAPVKDSVPVKKDSVTLKKAKLKPVNTKPAVPPPPPNE
jgi:hypothetical protein